MSSSLPPYTPEFLQRFWMTHGTTGPVHRYDAYTTDLSELSICDISVNDCVFAGFDTSLMYPGTRRSYDIASANFRALEDQAESVLEEIMLRIYSADDPPSTTLISIERSKVDILFKYFSLLRYRNSATYADKVHDLLSHITSFPDSTRLLEAYNGAFQQVTWRAFFQSMNRFMTSDTVKPSGDYPRSVVEDQLEAFCWSILRSADIYIGLTSNEQEFILPDSCFATLDESFTSDHESANNDVFFPITPSLALYFILSEDRPGPSSGGMTSIEIDHEAEIDVHLRNAMVLSSTSLNPNMETNEGSKLYFSSLFSITRSILSYEEFRCREVFTDFSRLKQRCRQKYLQTTVTKMLIVKDDIAVIDLSDEVEFIGSGAVAFGAFSDVWRGRWYDRMERKERVVAIKFLRQAMVQSMKDKVLRRLQAEVVTWHHLCHRNVAQLFGIVQSPTSIGMVSPWCSNGTIKHYLKDVNPNASRIVLLRQVASGVSYLHGFTPSIVHGDLKGGNILVDRHGFAIITDFGLSKVMSDLGPDFVGSSFFAGSMRWMAPELIDALVSDEDNAPRVTTASDIFAFASVCLEIVTGQLPYQNKKNDQAVMLDIIRRVKPHWGSPGWSERLCEPFIQLLESCWDECPLRRPGMIMVCTILGECES